LVEAELISPRARPGQDDLTTVEGFEDGVGDLERLSVFVAPAARAHRTPGVDTTTGCADMPLQSRCVNLLITQIAPPMSTTASSMV
jgi:hypothetical protein